MLIQGLILGALAVAQPAPSQTTAATPASAPTRISDEEVPQFASASSSITNIRADSNGSDADRNRRVANVIKATGLTPARYEQITRAMQADPALQRRIQAEGGDVPKP